MEKTIRKQTFFYEQSWNVELQEVWTLKVQTEAQNISKFIIKLSFKIIAHQINFKYKWTNPE